MLQLKVTDFCEHVFLSACLSLPRLALFTKGLLLSHSYSYLAETGVSQTDRRSIRRSAFADCARSPATCRHPGQWSAKANFTVHSDPMIARAVFQFLSASSRERRRA